MTHQALYREWRPRIFDEVVEQRHVVYALRQAVISGQIVHAYLFSGTRGTGKTTLAKIFARAINCENPQNGNPCNQCVICEGMLNGSLLDIVEMDAASNNSVENIRRICDEVVFMPSQARFKVYIIDEVHMLSTGAFNALLKTLEEPPSHAVFILATTEPHRIPATILSRCQRYEFRRIPIDSLIGRLAEIAAKDDFDVDREALKTIAVLADGALRDAISLLDQAHSSFPGKIGRDQILDLTGVVQDEFLQQISEALFEADAAALLTLIDELVMTGRDLARFVSDLAQHFRNVLVCQVTEDPQQLVRATAKTLDDMRQLAERVSTDRLIAVIKGLSALLSDLRWAADMRTALEIGLIRLMNEQIVGSKPDRLIPDGPPAAPDPKPPAKPAGRSTPPPPATDRQAEPEQTSETAQAESEQASEADTDASEIWQRSLDRLLADGHMALYLFCRPAMPVITDDRLHLVFDPADRINYQEACQDNSLRILKQAASAAASREIAVQPSLNEQAESASNDVQPGTNQPAWIQKIKDAADTLGVPVEMEE
ncbi:MAG: DNA polymerase III subunit gamma/tau [Clostridiaceae bacterium]|nr:DNA polymerase III subunit gamma/tau [Clostridiaceae bacterium]